MPYFLLVGVAIIAVTLYSLRREHIRVEYSVGWLAVGCILTMLSLFPGLLSSGSRRLGVPPQLLFVIVTGALLTVLLFGISRVVSRIVDDNIMLAQRVAILEFQLRSLAPPHGYKD